MQPRHLAAVLLLLGTGPAWAQSQPDERVVVYGTLADSDIGLSPDKLAGTLESLSAADITADHGATVLNSLGSSVTGAYLSDAQGNSMFQDLRYHGFAASPLQGTAQGIAVYQNGVRLNEAFGDTVNWDAIPEAAIARMDVWSDNPVFGLNALGGAINLVMKNGFTWQGADASLLGGSYGHGMASLQYGMTDGDFAFYATAEGVTDSGWRLNSDSRLARLYLDAGWRLGASEIHLVASGADSTLGVVGPTPVELAAQNSAAVYTWPQTTQNRVGSLAVNAKSRIADHWQVESTAYLRALRQRHLDGNDANFENCPQSTSYAGDLCLEDDGFPVPTGGKTTAFRNQFVILGPDGQTFPYDGAVTYGTDDRSFIDAVSQGLTVQATSDTPLFGFFNYFTAGGSIDHGAIAFRSTSTLGRMFPDLQVAPDAGIPGSGTIIHTQGNLGYAPADLAGTTTYYGLYLVDALDLTDALTVTAGFRANTAAIDTRDRSGSAPELTASHGYGHVNPLVGATFKFSDTVTLFGGYSEANRAPTPLELDCASPSQPCLLEGSLVADPPLKQVVAHTYEAGLRGKTLAGHLSWNASLYRTDSHDDIIALASVIQGHGYYANVPETRRQGADLSGRYDGEGWSVHASWSWLDATYRFAGLIASPNNPMADGDGNVAVTPGRHIPMSPADQLRAGGDIGILPGLVLGGDALFTGSQYYDGDPANQNPKLPAYWTVNLRATYELSARWRIFGVVDNLFDRHDATYATYFSPSDTQGLLTPGLTDPRTVTLEQPISFRLGLSVRL